ncbi:Gluconolactonase [Pseudocercospora fuligena]|uniref:Gluconolactonase n=1 Tax=Pseudocercospora fuligena TaxID=685502 RepID=A0A8H6VLA7_9PEZI|nr:Gluconolactonase [Pseudocercospora fuligena]
MPYHFYRAPVINNTEVTFAETEVANDLCFSLLQTATFVVFNQSLGLDLLGPDPSYEVVFNVTDDVHEAPVYVPALNKIFLSRLAQGYLPQLVIDLNHSPPTLSEYTPNPPIYAANGGTFHDGLIYYATAGGNNTLPGGEQRPSIRTLDTITNQSRTLLNNYYGYYFNGPDDLFLDPKDGSVWFTDPDFSWYRRRTDTPPQLKAATYRFDPKRGIVRMVESTISQPNGIAMSPDGKTVYIAETGVLVGDTSADGKEGTTYNSIGDRTLYKFNVVDHGTNLCCKRPFWYVQDWIADGVKIAKNGFVVAATGKGIDVLSEMGVLIVRLQTDFVVQNFVWVPDTTGRYTEFWLMGNGRILRVKWELEGIKLA